MSEEVLHVVEHGLMITAFVAVMMISVEYLNVLSKGTLTQALQKSRLRQLLVAVLLGVLPGCLGSFMVVTLYTHRIVSLGALVACMIASSGDEAFVMLAMFPQKALLLFAGLAGLGIVVGIVVDAVIRPKPEQQACDELVVHEGEQHCCFPRGQILSQLRNMGLARGVLIAGTTLFAFGVAVGKLGPESWDWVRVTLLMTGVFGLFVVLTVSEHFLDEHLWEHTIKEHLPRLFLWTMGALVVVAFVEHSVAAVDVVRDEPWLALTLAGLLGLIPESGPHLVFVTMYAKGLLPLAVLVTSSIVQDGHGMIPLLAHSRRDFIIVKGINLSVGLAVGAVLLLLQ